MDFEVDENDVKQTENNNSTFSIVYNNLKNRNIISSFIDFLYVMSWIYGNIWKVKLLWNSNLVFESLHVKGIIPECTYI